MKRLAGLVIGTALSALGTSEAYAQSAFGCTNLSNQRHVASVEGQAGVFYRVNPDLHMHHPFSDQSVAQVAELGRALQELGTTLVYVPLPTKSLAMPRYLTSEAEDFGFDPDLATTVYKDAIKRLNEAGVLAVDARRAVINASAENPAFFKTDHRLTGFGAQLVAQAIAEKMRGDASFAGVPQGRFVSAPTAPVILDSDMRNRLQQHCLVNLPPVETMAFATTKSAAAAVASSTSLFANTARSARMAIVGTEYTSTPGINFAGFLSEFTGLDAVQYSVEDGGAFAAISSYMTSEAFQVERPKYLIWENPIYNNLGQFGDQPMRELIAAAGNTCRVPVNVLLSSDPNRLRVDLGSLDPSLSYTLFLDADGAASDKARFTFFKRDGQTRTKTVYRHENQVRTGRFYMPVSGLWADGAAAVDIELGVPFGGNPRVTACFF